MRPNELNSIPERLLYFWNSFWEFQAKYEAYKKVFGVYPVVQLAGPWEERGTGIVAVWDYSPAVTEFGAWMFIPGSAHTERKFYRPGIGASYAFVRPESGGTKK